MTLVEPYLFLNRLVIGSQRGTVAYDVSLHHGVNIIRGDNSSGKSTIANFIFYALGGDFDNWTSEARTCREVFAEVEINQATMTLKRTLAEHSRQAMSIFWGDYDSAKRSNFEGWKTFPYAQTTNLESFSSVLFNALGFPDVRAEDSKITMNQILRLIYIDQDSPIQSLMRSELFDPPVTRQVVSELLLGAYDDSLYSDRLRLRDSQQNYQQKKEQYDGISKVFGSTGNETDIEKLQRQVAKARQRLEKGQQEIVKVRAGAVVRRSSTTAPRIARLQEELASLKSQINKLTGEIREFELDIVDSKQFIEVLEKRLIALKQSISTRKVLGELPFEHCPHCLSPLDAPADDDHCVLCKQVIPKDIEKTIGKRLQQEIQQQIRESKKLLDEKREELKKRLNQLAPLVDKLNSQQREIDLEEKEYRSIRDEKLDELLINRGRLETEITFLEKQIRAAEQLELLQKELELLKSKIEALNLSIRRKEEKHRSNLQIARQKIESIAKMLLQRDLDRQPEFKTASSVEVDFYKDTYALDGQNNFSASSNTYLKNALRFAIFFASLELPFFRYPRLLICDNMEDKGMEQIRSQNFQRLIVEFSKKYDVEHQIIFTTSMIAPELEDTSYCIDAHYTVGNKSLKTSRQKT